MKEAMKQSRLIHILNGVSIVHLMVVILVFGLAAFISIKADNANEDRYKLTENATYFMGASSYLTREVRAYAATGDKQHYDNYKNELEKNKTREFAVTNMKNIGITTEEQAKVDEMLALSNTLVVLEEQSMKDVETGDKKSAVFAVLGSDYNTTITKIDKLKADFLTLLTERTTAKVDRLVLITRLSELLTVLFILSIVFFQMIAYRLINRKVIEPIIMVEKEMSLIAEGNLHSDFPLEPDTSEIGMMIASIITSKRQLNKYIKDISEKLLMISKKDMSIKMDMDYVGDFADIKDSMDTILTSMNTSFNKINDAADQVSEGAFQVSDGAQAIAATARQEASAIEQISETMSAISEEVQYTFANAKMATELANTAGRQLGKSNELLQGMLKAMKEIDDASGEIGKIISTIQDIASQTNMLSLNAAIEAARAGEAGKGFAVVAEEVRVLAGQSADASKNTSDLIQKSLDTIQSGSKIAENASETFVTVMIDAGKAAKAMGDISIAAEKQAADVKQVMNTINEMVSSVQNNSASSEESAAASEQFVQLSESLKLYVQQFKLRV